MRDEYKRLMAQAAKEEAEARRWAIRHSYAAKGVLLLGPDELSGRDVYPLDLEPAAIAAGVAYITAERVERLVGPSAPCCVTPQTASNVAPRTSRRVGPD
jgi:hypothetical protein